MPITPVGVGALAAAATASITPAYPSGLLTDDFLLGLFYSRAGSTPTPPAGMGWLQAQTGLNSARLTAWYRFFTSGDTSGAWTGGGTTGFYGAFSSFRGVDPTSPLDVSSPAANTGTDTSAEAPNITTVTDGAFAVSFFGNIDNGGGTGFAGPTAGWTLNFGGNTYTSTAGSDGAIAQTYREIESAGAAGINVLTVDDDFGFGNVGWTTITIALRPFVPITGPPPRRRARGPNYRR